MPVRNSVAAALAKGCSACQRPLDPETALLATVTWALVGSPKSQSRPAAALCCQECFDKYSQPENEVVSLPARADNFSSRFVLYDFDRDELATTSVYNSYEEAAEEADLLHDVIVLKLPVARPTAESSSDEDEPAE